MSEPNPKRYRRHGQKKHIPPRIIPTLRGALEDLFSRNPIEHWIPWGLPQNAIRGTLPAGTFFSLPEGLILDIAAYLAPHELDNFFGTSKTMRESSKSESAYKLRLASCVNYYSILKVYADNVQSLVVGGWREFIKFMTKVAHRLQNMYNGFEVHKLHRALVAEQIIGAASNFQGLIPFHPNHLTISETDESERYEPNRQPQHLNLDDAFPDYNNDEHLPHVHFGDLSMTEMFEAGSEPPTNSNLDGNIHPNEIDRVEKGLLPVILIYREEEDGNEISIGFGGPDAQNQQRVYLWEAGYNDEDDAPTWLSRQHDVTEFPASIVATFCMDMHQEHTSRGYYRMHVREFAWLWAHKIAPFGGDQDAEAWLSIIWNEEERIRKENRTNYGTEDPFGRKREDDALFKYACDVVGSSNGGKYTTALPEEYVC